MSHLSANNFFPWPPSKHWKISLVSRRGVVSESRHSKFLTTQNPILCPSEVDATCMLKLALSLDPRVFSLLEAVYAAFDKIAVKRRVFKVIRTAGFVLVRCRRIKTHLFSYLALPHRLKRLEIVTSPSQDWYVVPSFGFFWYNGACRRTHRKTNSCSTFVCSPTPSQITLLLWFVSLESAWIR